MHFLNIYWVEEWLDEWMTDLMDEVQGTKGR